ncbi:MAG: ABC transporter substrate-binding protein [Actinomyces sp.]|jgi:branched-chain amino acid transport system substrate-binding protein|nr:ABC transporter substrate-binding protein [Actinomyces sp.]MCI1642740.1 ABC transporter substrate-binding protein [Actinomyces sp.]MCI1663246.1 ABC transporter substrate-binding protein [Actinomyces sp.]MCI1692089.1 ABC transporter substrate-binding protein [Actinomyces sp.]MCI1789006.1 ABC transporter substrate-binding protein [Actinomyces sp.]MCI1830431.1 ABC transporter substrate-binding protein [Actinomyces sp.]
MNTQRHFGPPAARSLLRTASLGAVAALALAACASGGSSSSDDAASGDGAAGDSGGLDLSIGTILPQTGSLATLGPPEIAGVDLAVKEINDAAKGLTVEVTHTDSGDTTTNIATQSATSLLSQGVSTIIGAASSGVSMTIIDQITQAGVVEISPANTSPDFTDYDDDGFYWRTAPSDVLQGQILGNKIIEDGKTNVAILYMNDPYGIGLSENIAKTLEAAGVTVAANITYDPAASNFTSEVGQILGAGPDAVVVVGFEESKVIFSNLATEGYDFANVYGTDGNYGLMQPGDEPDIAGAQFSSPGVKASDDLQSRLQDLVKSQGGEELQVFTYGPESYDAVILSALAALQGGAADGTTIRDNLESVSKDGTKCTAFAECADLIAAGTDVDYDGQSGPVTFDAAGDVTEATVSIYKYTSGNESEWVDGVEGSLS